MERRDLEVEPAMDAYALIRLNSLVELRFLLEALIWQHKFGNTQSEDYE